VSLRVPIHISGRLKSFASACTRHDRPPPAMLGSASRCASHGSSASGLLWLPLRLRNLASGILVPIWALRQTSNEIHRSAPVPNTVNTFLLSPSRRNSVALCQTASAALPCLLLSAAAAAIFQLPQTNKQTDWLATQPVPQTIHLLFPESYSNYICGYKWQIFIRRHRHISVSMRHEDAGLLRCHVGVKI